MDRFFRNFGETTGVSWTKVGVWLTAFGLTLQLVTEPGFTLNADTLGQLATYWGGGGALIGARDAATKAKLAKS